MRRLFLLLGTAAAAAWPQEPAPDIPGLLAAGNAAYMKADYQAARDAFSKAWDLAENTDPDNPVRYDVAKRLSSVCAAQGLLRDSDIFLSRAIAWREEQFGRNDPKLADDLLTEAGLYRALKDYDRARLILARVVGIHRHAFGPESTALADDFSRIARTYLEEKKMEPAFGPLKTALEIRTRAVGALDASLVPDLDRLGALQVAMHDYEQAENTYRQALVIRETILGKDDADLIATVDGLAYSSFGLKKYDQAEALYKRLIDLWVKSVDEDHPMVALALDKLAAFYVDRKKLDEAKELTDRAIAIRARFLALGLSLAATEQIHEEHNDAAAAMYRRAINAMDPVHPLNASLQQDMAGMLKTLEVPPPKPTAKTPPARKK